MEIDLFKMFYTVAGGLGLFLFGMNLLSQGLQSLGSTFIKKAINYITANRVFAVIVGTLVTAFVQSSSVSTVMMSSFVNAGLMTLTQGIGFIFGANIGTTITGWIISMGIGKHGLLLIGLGAIPMLFASNNKLRNTGRMLFALGLIFFGLEFMGDAFKPLRNNSGFKSFMVYFKADSPLSVLACMGIGCLLTMIIQSSSAMLGITITLAATEAIGFPTAAALVLGENIGTTITLWIASIGAQTVVKRTALAHTSFNLFGCLIIFCIFQPYLRFIDWMMPGDPYCVLSGIAGENQPVGRHIAAVHTVFNISMTVIFLPFLNYLVRFVCFVIPDRKHKEKEKFKYFGNVRNLSPVMGMKEAQLVLDKMAEKTSKAINDAGRYLTSEDLDPKLAESVRYIEHATDDMQTEITLFLSKIMHLELDEEESRDVNAMIRICDELESICDYCLNIVKYRDRLFENHLPMRQETREILSGYMEQIKDFYARAKDWIGDEQCDSMRHFLERYDELNDDADKIRDRHLHMIKEQQYPPMFGLTFSDIMIALRRIKNHTLNIGEAICGGRCNY